LIENVDYGLKFWGKTSWRVWRNLILIPLVAFFCFSVTLIGPQFKVNNIWVVIPDGNSATMAEMGQLLGDGRDGSLSLGSEPGSNGCAPNTRVEALPLKKCFSNKTERSPYL